MANGQMVSVSPIRDASEKDLTYLLKVAVDVVFARLYAGDKRPHGVPDREDRTSDPRARREPPPGGRHDHPGNGTVVMDTRAQAPTQTGNCGVAVTEGNLSICAMSGTKTTGRSSTTKIRSKEPVRIPFCVHFYTNRNTSRSCCWRPKSVATVFVP